MLPFPPETGSLPHPSAHPSSLHQHGPLLPWPVRRKRMNSSSHLMQSPDEKGDFYSMSPHSCLPALNRSGETYLAPWHHVYIHHTYSFPSRKKMYTLPWLVWLSGLSTGLWAKGSPVRFPVRAHAWVAGQVRSQVGECERGNHTLMFLSLPPLSKINKI